MDLGGGGVEMAVIRVLEEGDEMQAGPEVPEARGLLGGWGQGTKGSQNFSHLSFCLTSQPYATEQQSLSSSLSLTHTNCSLPHIT